VVVLFSRFEYLIKHLGYIWILYLECILDRINVENEKINKNLLRILCVCVCVLILYW
jgi:hypothetical protein